MLIWWLKRELHNKPINARQNCTKPAAEVATMIPKVTDVKYVNSYRLWIRFADGAEGEIDFESEMWGPVFEAIKDPAIFKQVTIDPELNTIAWPNGADFAPEFLYKKIAA